MPLFGHKKTAQAQAQPQQGQAGYNQPQQGQAGYNDAQMTQGQGQGQLPQANDRAQRQTGGYDQTATGNQRGGVPGAAVNSGAGGAGYDDQQQGRHRERHGATGHRGEGAAAGGAGAVVGSQALHAQGGQLDKQAQSYHSQGDDLAEAERLEREAGIRRERAVAHGAPAENRALGAGANI